MIGSVACETRGIGVRWNVYIFTIKCQNDQPCIDSIYPMILCKLIHKDILELTEHQIFWFKGNGSDSCSLYAINHARRTLDAIRFIRHMHEIGSTNTRSLVEIGDRIRSSDLQEEHEDKDISFLIESSKHKLQTLVAPSEPYSTSRAWLARRNAGLNDGLKVRINVGVKFGLYVGVKIGLKVRLKVDEG